MKKWMIAISLFLVISPKLYASETDSTKADQKVKYEFKPITVTATRAERPILRVPYAINVIEQKGIQRASEGISFDKVLRKIPGVIINNRQNLSSGDKISMRGIGSRAQFGSRGIKIVLDGIPLNMPDGQAFLKNLDLGSIGKIEVLRGPSSSLYGNASGGVINVHTQHRANKPFVMEPQLIVGSHGLQKWQGKISGNIGRHAYIINTTKLTLTGFREHSAADYASISAVSSHEISEKMKLSAIFHFYDAPYLLNPSSLSKADAESSPEKSRYIVKQQASGQKFRQSLGGVALNYKIDSNTSFESTLYISSRSLFVPIVGRIIEPEGIYGGVRSVFNKHFQIMNKRFRWIAGMDIEAKDDSRKEHVNSGIPRDQVDSADKEKIFELVQYGSLLVDYKEKITGYGPFCQLDFSPVDNLTMTLGQRYDYYQFQLDDYFLDDGSDDSGTRVMEQFSPMIGIVFRPVDYIKLYSNYSTAFQTPTSVELGNRPTGVGGFNPDLNPETLKSVELGVKGISSIARIKYDCAIYLLDVQDKLIPFQIQESESGEVYYRNAGRTENMGLEIKLDWLPFNGLELSLAYAIMDFKFKDFEVETFVEGAVELAQLGGNSVPGVPPQQIFAGISYEHRSGIFSEIDLLWADEFFANDFNGPAPGETQPIEIYQNDSYAVVDMRFGIQNRFKCLGIHFYLGINNLFNQRYTSSVVPNAFGNRFFEPAPGRGWYSGLNISF